MSRLAAAIAAPQTVRLGVRFGRRARGKASVSVTPAGLLAIGALVAAILLSVPPIIRAAAEARRAAE